MREETAERSSAIFKAAGAAVLYFASGALLEQLLSGKALLCALLQPIPVLIWAKQEELRLGAVPPKGGWVTPAAVFCALAFAASRLLPGAQTGVLTGWELLRVCIAVPIAEELVFHSAVQGFLRPLGGQAAAVAAAALFAVQHGGASGMLYAFCMGMVLGWLRERSGSVLPCILLHSVNNLLVFLAG